MWDCLDPFAEAGLTGGSQRVILSLKGQLGDGTCKCGTLKQGISSREWLRAYIGCR